MIIIGIDPVMTDDWYSVLLIKPLILFSTNGYYWNDMILI